MRKMAAVILSAIALLSVAQAIDIAQVDVKVGGAQPLMLRDDGTVWTWGVSRLEDGRPAGPWTAHAIAPLEHIVAIGAGSAVDRSGHVWTWPLGTPTVVDGIDAAITADSGFGYTIAIQRGGTVWSWRDNTDRTASRPAPAPPVQVQGLEDVNAVDAGPLFAVALTRSGNVSTWNENVPGETGGFIAKRTTPVRIEGLKDIIAVAAGADHLLALGRDGRVWAWGKNERGQLGDGTGTDRAQPVPVTDLASVSAIAAGGAYSVALRKDGTLWAWGTNLWGQLGDGTMAEHRHPVPVRNLSHVMAVAAGDKGTLAMCEDGSVWAWGANGAGQLGYAPNPANRSSIFSTVPQRIPRLSWQHEPQAEAVQPAPPVVTREGGTPPTPPQAAAARPSVADEQLQYGLDDLRSADPTVRRRGAAKLGDLGVAARAAIPELERAMQSDDPALHSAALRSYIEIMRNDPAGVPTIVAALSDPGARDRAEGVLRSIGAPAVPFILKLMQQADGPTRGGAARVLKIADLTQQDPTLVAATVDAIIPGLSDAEDAVRLNSAAALAPFGPLAHKAAPALVRVLETSKVEYTRQAAIVTLGEMGPGVPEVMPVLAKALRDVPRVSTPAREALESIGTPEAKEILAQWPRGEPK